MDTNKWHIKWNGYITVSETSIANWVYQYCLSRNDINIEDFDSARWYLTEQEFDELIDDNNEFTWGQYVALLKSKNDDDSNEVNFSADLYKEIYRKTIIYNERANFIIPTIFGLPPYEICVEVKIDDEIVKWRDLWKVLGCVKASRIRAQICEAILENGSSAGEIVI